MVLAGLDAEEIANAVEDQFAYRLSGGEEAFVACVYAIATRLPTTRFAVSALPFIKRLIGETAYLKSLRELWKSRTFDVKKLPSNDELLAVLGSLGALRKLNPLTGVDRGEQHDMGIILPLLSMFLPSRLVADDR